MKKQLSFIIVVALVCISAFVNAQVQQSFNYQAVLRDTAGAPLASQAIDMRFTIRTFSETGPVVYRETTSGTTSAQGLFMHAIGTGTVDQGTTVAAVDWTGFTAFLQVEISRAGGPYTSLGTQELVSVPTAFLANKSVSAQWALYANTASYAITAGENISFRAETNSVQNFNNSAHQVVEFPQTDFNDHNGWSTNNNSFTAPSSGVYHFDVSLVLTTDSTGTSNVSLFLENGSTQLARTSKTIRNDLYYGYISLSVTVELNAGDEVAAYIISTNNLYTYNIFATNYFSGYKVR